ncbi:nuclear transport factor 2 family protein [Muricauda sp. CAU 1633]|uniref:nuclear transport factor 2 family protein n=1 Tax=Allomuricauda sp. CAU 1633 TaxID=2816036 RepID=UPI001A8FE886|nr:nuclear transport factor 2 family protein [Muricauda sp. CAU 1633]MBO0320899.1 nuclear transport factor 2 family protein [Muricauda sp. CAU 1633]
MMYTENRKAIEELISNYFEGIFEGDGEKLEKCFHENTYLYGDIKGEDYLKSKAAYIEGVKNRQSPKSMEEEFKMSIIGIDILGKVTMAKLHVPFSGYNYYDYLSLAKMAGEWKIVNKIFTHVD